MKKKERLLKYRQGDVYIFAVEKTDYNFKQVSSKVLAYGEVTGHSHQIVTEKGLIGVAEIKGQLYLRITDQNAMVKHEEHYHINLPPGDYKVIIQREYDPVQYQRSVMD